ERLTRQQQFFRCGAGAPTRLLDERPQGLDRLRLWRGGPLFFGRLVRRCHIGSVMLTVLYARKSYHRRVGAKLEPATLHFKARAIQAVQQILLRLRFRQLPAKEVRTSLQLALVEIPLAPAGSRQRGQSTARLTQPDPG